MSAISPWMRSVPLTTKNTNYNLLTLMRAVDTEAPATCGAFQLQPVLLDSTENGKFRAGNQPLSDTDAGVEMFAGQTFGMASVINNISLQHIWVRCEKDSQLLNVTVVVL